MKVVTQLWKVVKTKPFPHAARSREDKVSCADREYQLGGGSNPARAVSADLRPSWKRSKCSLQLRAAIRVHLAISSCSVILLQAGGATRWQHSKLKQATSSAVRRCQQPRTTPRKPPPQLSVALQSHASGAATVAALERPVALLNDWLSSRLSALFPIR